jgi:Cdc6-like AAA superfamily ATPase
VDEKAIELLSKRVAASSGDARKFKEILARSVMGVLDGMSEDTSNSRHEKPLIRPPHIMKIFKESTTKWKDLVEGSPANERAILCLCIRLAPVIRSRPIPLSTLFQVCRGAFDALELATESDLKWIIERLLASGLLKLMDQRIPANNMIRFDSQLQDVAFAVEEVLTSTIYYRQMVEKLLAMKSVIELSSSESTIREQSKESLLDYS